MAFINRLETICSKARPVSVDACPGETHLVTMAVEESPVDEVVNATMDQGGDEIDVRPLEGHLPAESRETSSRSSTIRTSWSVWRWMAALACVATGSDLVRWLTSVAALRMTDGVSSNSAPSRG